MGGADSPLIDIGIMPDNELKDFLKKNAISLTLHEARKITELIVRNPTLTELHMFNIQWSEHSSYKSSRAVLKMLPTKAPNVILGPVEDSGIVELGIINGEKYGIVISHESHNHPSQVVPYEGAATGIGGDIGDVYFNDSFDDNCLVNVVCLGIVKEKDIIHSYAPKNAAGYDIVIVEKPTDNSGFGGAAFASLILNEEE